MGKEHEIADIFASLDEVNKLDNNDPGKELGKKAITAMWINFIENKEDDEIVEFNEEDLCDKSSSGDEI